MRTTAKSKTPLHNSTIRTMNQLQYARRVGIAVPKKNTPVLALTATYDNTLGLAQTGRWFEQIIPVGEG